MKKEIFKFASILFCLTGVALPRTEYVISNSKITSINTDSNSSNRRSGGDGKSRYSGENYSHDSSEYRGAWQKPSVKKQVASGGSDLESAMMQLQDQLTQLDRKIEDQAKRITMLEKQNALLLENNLKLEELINKKLEMASKLDKKNNSKTSDNRDWKTVKNSQDSGERFTKDKLNEIRDQIAENFCTKSIKMIDSFLPQKSAKKYAAELYFWRGVANYQKGSFLQATEDLVESYSRKPNRRISKYLLYYLAKSLRKTGKAADAKIIEGKISVDYPDFNMKKDYKVWDIK